MIKCNLIFKYGWINLPSAGTEKPPSDYVDGGLLDNPQISSLSKF